MTVKEVCEKYGIAESTLTNAFPRTQKAIYKKYGVRLVKEGRGKGAEYREEESDCRAMTMYEETKDSMVIDNNSFQLMDMDFFVFITILTTPMFVFRGSYEEFLKYTQTSVTKTNILLLKESLESLEKRGYISYTIDKTDKNWFVAALYRKVEEEFNIEVTMIKRCKQLADKHHKRSWIPLLKTWVGVQVAAENQPFTLSQLSAITGLSRYQIIESKKILERDEIFLTSKAYACLHRCIGSNVMLNGFYN